MLTPDKINKQILPSPPLPARREILFSIDELASILKPIKYADQRELPTPSPELILNKGDKVWVTKAGIGKDGQYIPIGIYSIIKSDQDNFSLYSRALLRGPSEVTPKIKATLAAVGQLQIEAVNALSPTDGWKLHLNFNSKDSRSIAAVDAALNELKVRRLIADFKIGHGGGEASGQPGKEATVYIGDGNNAKLIAGYLNRNLAAHLLYPPPEILNDDIVICGKVAGRFDIGKTDPRFAQYGFQGFPKLMTTLSNEDPLVTARKVLESTYGEFFSAALK